MGVIEFLCLKARVDMNEFRGPEHIKNADSWSRQPRPLENGNWVCDDPHCANVNYPRRTEVYLKYHVQIYAIFSPLFISVESVALCIPWKIK